MKYEPKTEKEILCPLEYGLSVFGGKWTSRVICVLAANGVMRYSAIRKELTNVTDAVLAATLREMTALGLVRRQQYDEIPPRVEYSLSGRGESVLPILRSICLWSREQTNDSLERKLPPCVNCSQ